MYINFPLEFTHRMFNIQTRDGSIAPYEVFVISKQSAELEAREKDYKAYDIEEISHEYAKDYLKLVFGKDFDDRYTKPERKVEYL